ncbi:MAG: hypothetical protein PHZ25_03440, partial [Candidatus Pacebacteria bacterium]|nr:hypothetical protein [Candidatus Paceibacterota bacterium]
VEESVRWTSFKNSINNDFLLPYKIEFLDIPQDKIDQWYKFIFQYLKMKPTPGLIEAMLIKTNLCDEKTAKLVAEEVKNTLSKTEITNKINEIFVNFSWNHIAKCKATERIIF